MVAKRGTPTTRLTDEGWAAHAQGGQSNSFVQAINPDVYVALSNLSLSSLQLISWPCWPLMGVLLAG
jgi:hypothetical protein